MMSWSGHERTAWRCRGCLPTGGAILGTLELGLRIGCVYISSCSQLRKVYLQFKEKCNSVQLHISGIKVQLHFLIEKCNSNIFCKWFRLKKFLVDWDIAKPLRISSRTCSTEYSIQVQGGWNAFFALMHLHCVFYDRPLQRENTFAITKNSKQKYNSTEMPSI
jgi:hypothetical protein